MKKGFLFGLGVLLAGSLLAATISTVSIDNKSPGDSVSNEEFNEITAGLGNLSSTFEGATSNDTSITITKTLDAPELCINTDCKTEWPTDGTGGGVTAKTCPTGQQLQTVDSNGNFTCGTDQVGAAGTGDNLGDYVVLQDLLPEMTGATALMGNPGGSPEVVSTRNIGSQTQWFSNLWVEDLHVGNQSLYMNGVKILESDPAVEMKFTADIGQNMSISTKGDGAEMFLLSEDTLNMEVTADAIGTKALTIANNSSNGTIEIATASPAMSNPNSKISINSPKIVMGTDVITPSKIGINQSTPAYTLDVNGDINFTGTLYEDGVAFAGGTGGDTSPWETATNGIAYKDGFVGIGTENPTTNLDVSGGEILAEKFCINTPETVDACDSKTCSAGMESGEGGSTCFTQATLTALESLVDTGGSTTSYWSDASPYSGGTGDIYYNESGNVGIGVTEPSAKLEVSGDIKLSNPDGGDRGGDLLLDGTIQIGGHTCPAPEATCTNAGEIASCGAGGAILACAGVDSKWMPITSHNGTLVGSNSYTCNASQKGIMRFNSSAMGESLQICMKEEASTTYSWRTIMSGGGTAAPTGGEPTK